MPKKQTIYLLNPLVPPALSGVGDHTARLAAEIHRRGGHGVKVLTASDSTSAKFEFPVERVFDTAAPRSIAAVVRQVERERPDWMIVQFDPFSYGGLYGINPHLVSAVWRIKRRTQTKIGLVVHESFVPVRNGRSAILSALLQAQLWCMCQACEVIFAVIEPWTQQLQRWFPGKRIEYLPVGSNIPLVQTSKQEVRRQLNIEEGTSVLGFFGHVGGSRSVQTRNLKLLSATVEQAQSAGLKVLVLYLGLEPDRATELLGHLPLLALGPLAPEEVSTFLAAVDVYLLPIVNGVSTRRGSLMCALQHGLPIVGTSGPDTDRSLQQENGKAFLLAPEQDAAGFAAAVLKLIQDLELRQALSARARALFLQKFTWDQIGSKLLTALASMSAKGSDDLP